MLGIVGVLFLVVVVVIILTGIYDSRR